MAFLGDEVHGAGDEEDGEEDKKKLGGKGRGRG